MSSECESAIPRRARAPRTWPRPYAARTWLIARSSSFRGGVVPAAAVPLEAADARITAPQTVSERTSRRWILTAAGPASATVRAEAGSPCPPASVGAAAAHTGDPLREMTAACRPYGLEGDGRHTSRCTFHTSGREADACTSRPATTRPVRPHLTELCSGVYRRNAVSARGWQYHKSGMPSAELAASLV